MKQSQKHAESAGGALRAGFDRTRLPDPLDYYTRLAGLSFRERSGQWRTTRCEFHGGHDSMRINVVSGGFVCMADCGARGGDIVAYHQAINSMNFIEAAKALGAWIDDSRGTHPVRPTPLSARDALSVLAAETNLVAVAASNMAHGVALSQLDLARMLAAAGRITKIAGYFA